MIYLKEILNLAPASPETRDAFIAFAQADLLPAYPRLGARLVGAWFSHAEWYGQITQVLEFDDLSSFEAFRKKGRTDDPWLECQRRVEKFAPQRSGQLLEPFGPVSPDTLHAAIQQSRDTPLNASPSPYSKLRPGRWPSSSPLLTRPRGCCRSSRRGEPLQAIRTK